MEYKDIRSQIRSGDVLAWSHTGLKSWHDFKILVVRMATRSEYSHVGTAWVIGERVFVIEAVVPTVRIMPLSQLGDFYWTKTKAPWTMATEDLALSYVGQKYSQLQAMISPFHEPKKDNLWQCSELVKAILASDGITIPYTPTPANIMKALAEKDLDQGYVKNS